MHERAPLLIEPHPWRCAVQAAQCRACSEGHGREVSPKYRLERQWNRRGAYA
jgi:hypothetical protein